MSWATASVLLHGNAVIHAATDGRGQITALTPVPWPWIQAVVVTGSDGPRLAFNVVHIGPEVAVLNLPPRILDVDCIHLRARSDAGLIGRSVLSRAAGPVREAIEIAEVATGLWRNSMRPSAVATLDTFLDESRRKRFEEDTLPKFAGAMNAGKVPLLEGGMTIKALSLSPQEAELIQSRQFSLADIARLFCVPEPLLQIGQRVPPDLAAVSTLFAQQCLAPLVSVIEAEFSAILPPGAALRLDMDGLMRGSFGATVAALAALKQSGIVTANDARAELGWPAIPGGDVLATGAAPNWPADGPGSTHLGPSPGHTGDGPPAPGNHHNTGAA